MQLRENPFLWGENAFFRSPTLPSELYQKWLSLDEIGETELIEVLSLPGFLAMLYIASPTLAENAILFMEKPSSFSAKRRFALSTSVFKYLCRATMRTTPFGAFAGIGCARLSLEPQEMRLGRMFIRARADFQYVLHLVDKLEKNTQVLRHLSLCANPTLYEKGERLYICFRDRFGTGASEALSLKKNRAIEYVLSQTQCPRNYSVLLQDLCKEFPQPTERLERFLVELVANQVLLSSLRPPPTEHNPLGYVLDRIPMDLPVEEVAEARKVQDLINYFNHSTPQNPNILPSLRQVRETLGFKLGTRQDFLQVDMVFAGRDTSLPLSLGKDAVLAAEALLRLSPEPARSSRLAEYLNEYIEVYGHREMPLLEVLDPQLGLGPPAGYLNPPPRRRWSSQGHIPADDKRQMLLARLVIDGLSCTSGQVELTLKDLAGLPLLEDELPDSLDLFAFLLPRQSNPRRSSDYRLLVSTIGASSPSGRALGRFAYLDPHISSYLAEAGAVESRHNPEVMFADILYIHQSGRANNVSICPSVRPWQIVVGASGSASERQILLSDIWLGVENGHFFLFSRRYQKKIVAYFNHMLSYLYAPNVVRFMIEVSQDGTRKPAGFSWGDFAHVPRLPRVVLAGGRVILSPMVWNLPRFQPAQEGTTWEETFASWRERWRLPQYVYVAESDNRLLLNLDSKQQRGILEMLSKSSAVRLEEALPAPNDGIATDAEGKTHVVEIVLPLRRSQPRKIRKAPRITTVDSTPEQRKLLPGQGCLYFKLYGPRELQGDLLCEIAKWLDRDFPQERWFFIRYRDPADHLRLRFFSVASSLQDCLLTSASIFTNYLRRGLINRVCIDTYERELERYGGLAGIELCESIFCTDSRWAAQLEGMKRGLGVPELELGFFSVDMFLRGLGLNRDQRRQLYEFLHDRYGEPYQAQRKKVSRLFSESRQRLYTLLSPTALAQDAVMSPLNAWAADFRCQLSASGRALQTMVSNGKVLRDHEEILGSLIHMHCNRLGLEVASEHLVVSLLALAYQGFQHYIPEGVEL